MNAELIKQKIAMAIDKINALKNELKEKKDDAELLGMEISELKEKNEILTEKNRVLNEEKVAMSENNANVTKEIEGKLDELDSLFIDEEGALESVEEEMTEAAPVETVVINENDIESSMESLNSLLD